MREMRYIITQCLTAGYKNSRITLEIIYYISYLWIWYLVIIIN